jgi:hypothetical protein
MTRERLRDRRASETFKLDHAGLRYSVTFSRFDDGRVAEAFIANHKRGGSTDVAARDAGILLSFCLQFGCSIEDRGPIELLGHGYRWPRMPRLGALRRDVIDRELGGVRTITPDHSYNDVAAPRVVEEAERQLLKAERASSSEVVS